MLVAGSRLSGRYRIDKALGKGGMGAVYLAHLESLGNKPVAVKEMELVVADARTAEQAARQFQREATFLAHLEHPNLVRVTDFFQENGKHYLVMEYVKGETLQARLERLQRPFDWTELKGYALSLVEVLNYLHNQDPPILFRDLKPANIMLEENGRMKLIDFGIARTAQPGTETSTFLKGTGTNGFSPVEQYGMGETTDERSDIYALGATIYYLATGRIPPEAIIRVSNGKELATPSSLNPALPIELDAFLERCLQLRQDDRFSSMAEVREALEPIPAGRQDASAAAAHQPTMSIASPSERPAAITVEMFPSKGKNENSSNTALGLAAVALIAAAVLTLTTLALGGGRQESGDHLADTSGGALSSVAEPPGLTPPTKSQSPAPDIRPDVDEPRATAEVKSSRPPSQEARPRTTEQPTVRAPVKVKATAGIGGAPGYPKATSTPKTARAVWEAPAPGPDVAARPYPAAPASRPTAQPKIQLPLHARERLRGEVFRRNGYRPGRHQGNRPVYR